MSVPVSPEGERAPARSERESSGNGGGGAGRSRVLAIIAVERSLRALVFVVVGVVLVTHAHTDWGRTIADLARQVGLDPRSDGFQRLITKARSITPGRYSLYGVLAIAFGVLEGVEGYGLWNRKRWAEYLTVFATSLFFIPEIWELVDKPTVLKVGALLVNLVIVIYLVVRLRRHRE
jgi:uncharacterized membrane protein (DUF2068 family)